MVRFYCKYRNLIYCLFIIALLVSIVIWFNFAPATNAYTPTIDFATPADLPPIP